MRTAATISMPAPTINAGRSQEARERTARAPAELLILGLVDDSHPPFADLREHTEVGQSLPDHPASSREHRRSNPSEPSLHQTGYRE